MPGHGGADTTGLVLAGGRGSRMGGVDKGLVAFNGLPLALHAARRLAQQVGTVMVNANRHAQTYATWGYALVGDAGAPGAQTPLFDGPLAGMLAGLDACTTRWMLTVPCDCPGFPRDLAARLHAVAAQTDATVVMAATRSRGGDVRPEPVFSLIDTLAQASLARYLAGGGRKVQAWAHGQRHAWAVFDRPDDDPTAFANANTAGELAALQSRGFQAEPLPLTVPAAGRSDPA